MIYLSSIYLSIHDIAIYHYLNTTISLSLSPPVPSLSSYLPLSPHLLSNPVIYLSKSTHLYLTATKLFTYLSTDL